jgi:endonuclease G
LKHIASAILISVLSSSATADVLSVHCPLGCPSNPESNDLVFGHVYALSNNGNTKFADWVAYEVDVSNFGNTPGRKWTVEPLLDESNTLEAGDYKNASSSSLEADRGHQAPLASFAGSRYWSELNYLSNITPQDKDLNQGPWKKLEEAVRNAVSFRRSLFVITGPLYTADMPSMPKADEEHKVPSSYFKVVYDLSGKAAAFIMKQSAKRNDKYCEKRVSLSDLKADIRFTLPELEINQSIYTRLGC